MSADCLAKKTVATGGGDAGLGGRVRGATLAMLPDGVGATGTEDAGAGATAGRVGVVTARIDSVPPCSASANALSGSGGRAGIGSATGIGGGAVAVCAGSG